MNACIGDHVFSDAMIDLELLGLEYGRPIIQIGVTLFTLASAESEFGTFDPTVVQLFEGFRIPADRDACIWEPW